MQHGKPLLVMSILYIICGKITDEVENRRFFNESWGYTISRFARTHEQLRENAINQFIINDRVNYAARIERIGLVINTLRSSRVLIGSFRFYYWPRWATIRLGSFGHEAITFTWFPRNLMSVIARDISTIFYQSNLSQWAEREKLVTFHRTIFRALFKIRNTLFSSEGM